MQTLLKDSRAFSGFAVPDLTAANAFYGETLGLDVTTEPMGFLELHLAGGTHVLIYPKADHQPATYTMLNFPVSNVEQTVDALSARGVRFAFAVRHLTRQVGRRISRADGPKGAEC